MKSQSLSRGTKAKLVIAQAATRQHFALLRVLLQEYADSIQVDLCFQGFQQELAELPGKYAPPTGCLLLAMAGSQGAGCVALRRFDHDTCEMKRLYVRPTWRGQGLGRDLANSVIRTARQIGYRCMRLDSVESLKAALALYRSLGFKRIEPYCDNPCPGPVFMELDLAEPAP